MFSLQGHTALVTGGTRGTGQAVAIGLAEAGADVLLVQAQIYTADLSDPASVAALTPKVLADGHEVRVLVNCAGVQRRHRCEAFPDADLAEVMQVNLGAVLALTRDVGAHMLSLAPHPVTGRRGSVVSYASLLSFQGGLTVPAYAAPSPTSGTSRGVTVNAIAPGYIETDMNEALLNDPERLASISARIPAGRWGRPEDFKGTTVYLASKAAAYVSGHVLVVDGGWMGR
ncbi:hypothetical protein GGTG_04783 [Gaeumannomyces tritici R3-111a-1]|uniref:2-deoxy-D-gluconate 3-dehydrogenase n=1 Tax=Gaeumannomyces tritici (strain R3-111a-1) TaxID=644352 RepID=J3NU32_GAET3|nr:hypothetical protein GGTG_04783 [Gaeumannomyces tritici R3-111a-1]EJT79699.1 hypothetical protein GGTG_04783 [Gaeumannomyces tritici R3-111a-1]